jgi:hypothetical protein
MPETISCPDPACTAPAQVLDRWTWKPTGGPVEHVRTRRARSQVHTHRRLTHRPAHCPAAASVGDPPMMLWHGGSVEPSSSVPWRLPSPGMRPSTA